mmetsp:Transcript_31313/g.104631  ORF Transcript_31313/g.104631 Transcript_31313/m.104631 type:complete len:204 (+) Transcript_31313:630-1241(+)
MCSRPRSYDDVYTSRGAAGRGASASASAAGAAGCRPSALTLATSSSSTPLGTTQAGVPEATGGRTLRWNSLLHMRRSTRARRRGDMSCRRGMSCRSSSTSRASRGSSSTSSERHAMSVPKLSDGLKAATSTSRTPRHSRSAAAAAAAAPAAPSAGVTIRKYTATSRAGSIDFQRAASCSTAVSEPPSPVSSRSGPHDSSATPV